MCLINNTPPRLTWEQAQVVLEFNVHALVQGNNLCIEELLVELREERDCKQPCREEQTRLIHEAKSHRHQSRLMLATLETMMRGV